MGERVSMSDLAPRQFHTVDEERWKLVIGALCRGDVVPARALLDEVTMTIATLQIRQKRARKKVPGIEFSSADKQLLKSARELQLSLSRSIESTEKDIAFAMEALEDTVVFGGEVTVRRRDKMHWAIYLSDENFDPKIQGKIIGVRLVSRTEFCPCDPTPAEVECLCGRECELVDDPKDLIIHYEEAHVRIDCLLRHYAMSCDDPNERQRIAKTIRIIGLLGDEEASGA